MRVAVIDEQPLVRQGLACVLENEAGMVFCGGAANAREGLRLVQQEQPDLVMVELRLPGLGGIAATREMRRQWPGVKVAILSATCCERDVLDALGAGASGYLSKQDPIAAIVTGIRQIVRGEAFLGPTARMLALPPLDDKHLPVGPGSSSSVLAALSAREREVFELAIRGFRNREIARELCIAVKTVGSHRLQINRKLGCSSGTELIYFAATNGLLPQPVNDGGRFVLRQDTPWLSGASNPAWERPQRHLGEKT